MDTKKRFSLSDYNIIGFDLDGTLLKYNVDELAPLLYDLLTDYLVERKSYPKHLLGLSFDPDFIQKGLVIDTFRGNVIKLCSEGKILRVTHGTRPLNSIELKDIYGDSECWQLAKKFILDPLSVYKGPDSNKLHSLLDFFDYPAALVFAQAVDVIDETMTVQSESGYNVWSDILAGLVTLYRRENFSNDQSRLYKAIKTQPERYLSRTSTKVLKWLNDLRSAGKSLYLLTGSYVDFANFTSTYSMGPNWHELFDFVVCYARKPNFFKCHNPFIETDKTGGCTIRVIPPAQYLQPNTIYTQGNWPQLFESLMKINKFQGNGPTLYIGDNLLQDIYAPSLAGMQTVAVSEELLIDYGNSEFKNSLPSNRWGSYFVTDNKFTHWSNVIEKYANLCIPNLEALADLPINCEMKPANYGSFYPKSPDAFKSLH